MRGRSKSVPTNQHAGFFDDIAASINRRGSLPPLVREKSVKEERQASELDLMLGMVRGLEVLQELATDADTKAAVELGVKVINAAHTKLSNAEHISVFNAAPQILSFLWNKKSYNADMQRLRVKFTRIVVDENSISYWDALEIKMQALYQKTESRYPDEHRDAEGVPIKDENGSYLPLDDGDKYFKSVTGMCKFDLIALFGDLSVSLRNAIETYEKSLIGSNEEVADNLTVNALK